MLGLDLLTTNKGTMTRIISIFAITVILASSCQNESKVEDPAIPPTKVPEKVAAQVPEKVAEVAIASVTLLEDCPDAAKVTSDSDMDSEEGYIEPCGQSTMQIAVTGQGEASATLEIVEVRLLDPKGSPLEIIKSREPTIWKDNGYTPWDQVVLPKTNVKVSYKLSLGDWSKVEKTLGGSSYGPKFFIEADVEIGGVRKTIRSNKVARVSPEIVDT